ncbi:MAG: hypothetical protein ACKOC8_05880 [Pirellulales bacterium]
MNYLLVGLVALLLLAGLIAFGVGHRRWSWATVAAAFLVLLSAAGYFYVAARFAAYEWEWVEFVHGKQVELARKVDALMPGPDGRLVPADKEKSLAVLTDDRARWQRALERVETWRGRSWEKAELKPPKADGETGTIKLRVAAAATAPAEGEPAPDAPAEPAKPPIDAGANVYVFDTAEGEIGRYLGEFRVQSSTLDAAENRFVLTVEQTAPRDDYDRESWARVYDNVVVFENLPIDRWLAFSRLERNAVDTSTMAEPTKLSIDQVEEMLDNRDEQKQFIDEVREHDEPLADKEEWVAIRKRLESGESLPGTYWATVTFKESHAVAEGLGDEAASRSFEPDEKADFDLLTAFALEEAGTATIDAVRFRRPLRDAVTLIHGSRILRLPGAAGGDVPAEGIVAEGIAAIMAGLRQDIAALDASATRLGDAKDSLATELAEVRSRQERLNDDLRLWERDVAAATRTADAFEAEFDRSQARLRSAEAAIVERGAQLRAASRGIVERIDAAAPPASRPAAATP